MLNQEFRFGRFTSSEAHRLIKDKPRLTYVREKNAEIKMKRSLSIEAYSRAASWGLFLEKRVHSILGIAYKKTTTDTIIHSEYNFWAGTPDLINERLSIVSDIKCYQPLKFSQYIDCLEKNDIELFKDEFPQEYWQLVSNGILTGMKNMEAVVYMPYESELDDIRHDAMNVDSPEQWQFKFICDQDNDQLAHLPNDSGYNNLNQFVFEIPETDKELLIKRMIESSEMLLKQTT